MMDTTLLDDDMTPVVTDLSNEEINAINLEKIKLTDHLDDFRYGRHVLLALAILTVVGTIVGLTFNPYEVSVAEVLIEGCVLCAIYSICFFLISRKPLLALGLGLGTYLLVMALSALVAPESLYRGIIFKIVFLVGFYKGITGYLNARKSGDKLLQMGVPRQDVETALSKIEKISRTPLNKK